MDTPVYSVSEFIDYINVYLSSVGSVWVEGEISSVDISAGKWIFMNIKDAESVVSVFAVAYKIRNVRQLQAGMKVRVFGSPRLYKKSGRFSLFAQEIVPAGEGALRLIYEKLKNQLESEGLFDSARKRTLPQYPQKIGLITAPGSRAYSDFVKVLKNRMGGLTVYFYPVKVQGVGSAESVCEAIGYFNTTLPHVDLLVITRGGGSLEELQSFNDEEVARAVFASRIPVVVAVGHEADVALAELTADLRASTPSNAAELIVKNRTEALHDIDMHISHIDSFIQTFFVTEKSRLSAVFGFLDGALARYRRQIDAMIHRVHTTMLIFRDNLKKAGVMGTAQIVRIITSLAAAGRLAHTTLSHLERLMESYHYKNVLARGYAIALDAQKRIIKSPDRVKSTDRMTTIVFGGTIYSTVDE